MRGPEFVLIGQEVQVDSTAFRVRESPTQTDTEISFEMEPVSKRHIVGIQVTYKALPDESVIRKILTIRNTVDLQTFAVEEVFVDYWLLDNLTPDRAVEWGQPLFAGDWFFGVEHPAFWITNHGDEIGLCVAPAVTLAPGESITLPAGVVGAGSAAQPLAAFHRYLDTIRAQPARVFAMLNTWYHAPFVNASVCDQTLRELDEKLLTSHPGTLDAFVIDDGWDDHERLWHVNRERFPDGLLSFSEAVRRAGLRLGLWCSPWGGYEHARNERARAGARVGFGTMKDAQGQPDRLCLGEENYFRYYLDRLINLVTSAKVSFFKFDGYPYVCNDSNHGHPVGRGSVTWNANRMIEIARTLRRYCPEVFLLGTLGFWQSPWWLMYLDAIFIGGGDDGELGEGTPRQRDITYRDECIYQAMVQMKSRLPLAACGVHGIIKAQYHEPYYYNHQLAFAEETLTEWESLVWTNVGRGVGMVEAYLSPEILSDAHYRILAEGLAFLREQWQVLRFGRWWGGSPANGEAYGFMHYGDTDTMLFVRNPTAMQQTVVHGLSGTVMSMKEIGDIVICEKNLILGPFALILLSGSLQEGIHSVICE